MAVGAPTTEDAAGGCRTKRCTKPAALVFIIRDDTGQDLAAVLCVEHAGELADAIKRDHGL